jgi:hypothetical protein
MAKITILKFIIFLLNVQIFKMQLLCERQSVWLIFQINIPRILNKKFENQSCNSLNLFSCPFHSSFIFSHAYKMKITGNWRVVIAQLFVYCFVDLRGRSSWLHEKASVWIASWFNVLSECTRRNWFVRFAPVF